jgi:hypothetical protein
MPVSTRRPIGRARPPIVASGAAAPTPPLNALSSAPRACYSIRRRLLTTYTGPLIRVRKTTGGDTTTETDIGYAAATNALDLVALAAAVGSESWAIVTVYDQTTGARNITNATAANQPLGGTAGVGVTLSGFPAADLDGTNDRWARADALGLSGDIAMSLWVDCDFDTVDGLPISIGTNNTSQALYIHNNSSTLLKVAMPGSERVFTASSSILTGRQRLIARRAAGAGIGASKLMQNGAELVESSAVNPSNVLNLGTAATVLGAFPTGTANFNGQISEGAYWNADLSAPDLAIINGLT